MTGAYVGHGRQHIDYDTTQEHAAPDTTSDLAFRGILRDRATAVWSGMIKVDPGAQRTDAFQESRNLLLSDGAHADAIPGLEIEANDVRCTHAATVARIDEEQLFYLQSRGLDARRGRAPAGGRLPRGDRRPARGLAVPARRGLGRARARARRSSLSPNSLNRGLDDHIRSVAGRLAAQRLLRAGARPALRGGRNRFVPR